MEATLNQQPHKTIHRRLFRDELLPNTNLVNRTLAKEIDMSLTPVHEAMNPLAKDALVEYTRVTGTLIPKRSLQELAQTFDVRSQLDTSENTAFHFFDSMH